MIDKFLRKLNLTPKELLLFILFITLPLCIALVAFASIARGDVGSSLVSGFTSIFLGLVCIGYFNLFRRLRSKSPLEVGKQELYSETCGAQIGISFRRWPWAFLAIYYELLVIKSHDQVCLYPQDIWNLEISYRSIYPEMQIQHTRKDLSTMIIIWTWNPTALRNNIEEGLHLKEMPQYGKEPVVEGMSEQERKERQKYPWLQ